MQVTLKLIDNMKLEARNSENHITYFDGKKEMGADYSAATPMEVMLETLGGCSMMDVIAILKKKRKTIEELNVKIEADRAATHPMVFTKVEVIYSLKSPDTEIIDLEKAVQLSQEKYCSVSAMFRNSGCEVTYNCELV